MRSEKGYERGDSDPLAPLTCPRRPRALPRVMMMMAWIIEVKENVAGCRR